MQPDAPAHKGEWQTCRIGSCQRQENCMYVPCRHAPGAEVASIVVRLTKPQREAICQSSRPWFGEGVRVRCMPRTETKLRDLGLVDGAFARLTPLGLAAQAILRKGGPDAE